MTLHFKMTMTGFEPLAAAALTAAATSLTEIAVNVFSETGGGLLGRLRGGIDERTHTLITTAFGQYVKNYHDRHGTLKVLGMRRPVFLEEVYTSVRLLDNQDIQKLESIEALEKAYREQGQRRFSGDKKDGAKPGVVLARAEQYLMVLGSPGAGKSTFLRKIGLEAMKGGKGQLKHRCVPVFLELKRLTGPSIDVKQRIVDELTTCNFPRAKDFTERALKQGRLLILLDGLDEVPSDNQGKVIQAIQDFVDKNRENRFIASCRTAAYRTRFRQFTDVAIADFDDTQIEQYITNWFSSPEDREAKKAQTCWKLLQLAENQAAKELAQTPLLLTFLCLVYGRSQRFPAIRAQLYGKALRILLEEWAADKGIMQGDIYDGLSTELEEVLLAEIACTNFAKNQLFFTRRELVEAIKSFLANTLDAPEHLDGEKVLDAIAIQQGIFIERAEDAYTFSHLTLQEYLTAQYIVDHQQVQQLVTAHMFDQRWHEVFLLVPGLMRGGSDLLLQAIESANTSQIKTPKLIKLLEWADKITHGSTGDYKSAAKRVTAIYLALVLTLALNYTRSLALSLILARTNDPTINGALALALALDLNRDISQNLSLTRDLALTLTFDWKLAQRLEQLAIFQGVNFQQLISRFNDLKSQVPDKDNSIEVRNQFISKILQCWREALHLDPGVLNLLKDEKIALTNYFYANELLIRCRESAVRVSPKVWDEIEVRMMTVREV